MKKCPICKKMKPNKEVKKRLDPYELDINNKKVKKLMCDECEERLADDI
jgi:uncharacterized protein YlaI